MSHYFKQDKSLNRDLKYIDHSFKDIHFRFATHAGVFSKDHIDPATLILLNTIPHLTGTVLDLGCGYGCIGIMLAKAYSLRLSQADINPFALDLTRLNCEYNNVDSDIIESDCFDGIKQRFDTIIINPPIHAGKSTTYKMYENAPKHLNASGKLYVVTLKKHGAESTQRKLYEVFGGCEIIYKKKGVFVFACGG